VCPPDSIPPFFSLSFLRHLFSPRPLSAVSAFPAFHTFIHDRPLRSNYPRPFSFAFSLPYAPPRLYWDSFPLRQELGTRHPPYFFFPCSPFPALPIYSLGWKYYDRDSFPSLAPCNFPFFHSRFPCVFSPYPSRASNTHPLRSIDLQNFRPKFRCKVYPAGHHFLRGPLPFFFPKFTFFRFTCAAPAYLSFLTQS